MRKEVIITADKVHKRNKEKRLVKIALLILLLFLIVLYIILKIVYSEGKFTISLDSNDELESGLTISSQKGEDGKQELEADAIKFMDNISIKWLPQDIDEHEGGSHGAHNYFAYTFYIDNKGKNAINYWYDFELEDVILHVDEAIRIMVYLNGERTVYAKKSRFDGSPEEGTVPFRDEKSIIVEKRSNLEPNSQDKITVVVWLEGDDPECVDAIIGGELKLHMHITEEHIKPKE